MMFVTEAWQPLVEPETENETVHTRTGDDLKMRHILVLIAAGLMPLSFVSLAFSPSWSAPVAGMGISLMLFGVASHHETRTAGRFIGTYVGWVVDRCSA